MSRLLLCLTFFLFTVTVAPTPAIADDRIHVLSPPDNAVVQGKLINLIIRIRQDSFDDLRVTVDNNNFRSQPEAVVMFIVRHHGLILSEGKNLIRIEGLRGGHTEGEKLLTVFVNSPLSKQQGKSPTGLNQYIFHTPKNEKTCSPSPCHMQELRGEEAKSRQKETLPSCYTCHKRIIGYNYVHGPASVWACTTCHSKNSRKRRNAVPQPVVNVCRMCHTVELAAWQSEKFGHRPTMDGKCILCHSPHSSDEPFFLVKSASDLCGSCHQEKMTEPHVIIRPSGKGHPVKQQNEKGKRGISCASCHNPHAADNSRLLVKYNGSQIGFCGNCHH